MVKNNFWLSLGALILMTQSVQANVSWSFDTGNCTGGDCSNLTGSDGNVQQFGSGSNIVSVSAFSSSDDQNSVDPHKFETASLRLYGGGLGIEGQDDPSGSPDHSIDNNGGSWGDDIDAVRFNFNEDISLNGVDIGYKDTDADISVFAFIGNGDSSIVGKTFAELLASGWTLINHYSDLEVNQTEAINAQNSFASAWMITAYTPEGGSSQGWSTGNDYFKLSGISGAPSTNPGPGGSVPEPFSLILLLMSFLGWKIYNQGFSKEELSFNTLFA